LSNFNQIIIFLILILSACVNPVPQITGTEIVEIQVSPVPKNTTSEANALPTKIPTRISLSPTHTHTTPIEGIEDSDEYAGIVLFILGYGYDYRHYEGTRKSLERAGYRVLVASNTLDPIEGMIVVHGFESISRPGQTAPLISADLTLKNVQVEDYQAVVLISDSEILANTYPEIERILLKAEESGLVVAAQEFGIYLLAEAGLLGGKKVTANPLICRDLEANYDAICTLMPVQRDVGIVTADPTMSTVSFANAIMAEIGNEEY